jgi:hypothetical protein
MKDIALIDSAKRQFKGQLHLHTFRSPDCTVDYHHVLDEYKAKGFDFCLMTDHEVYWDSTECDSSTFLVLSGVENAFLPNPKHVFSLDYAKKKQMHFNLVKDVTVECGNWFKHDETLVRPVDYGVDSWNEQIRFYHAHDQLVMFNHPSWSRVEADMMLATCGCTAFEVWNNASIKSTGVCSDEVVWDYCLSRGKRIRAIATDDAHLYGDGNIECGGGFTMVLSDDFSKRGLVGALKHGDFYPSTGPRILDMRIVGGCLQLRCSPAASIHIISSNGICTTFQSDEGTTLDCAQWSIDTALDYFRVELHAPDGGRAWSQPVFVDDWYVDRE